MKSLILKILSLIFLITYLSYAQDNPSIAERRRYFNKDLFQRHLNFLGSDLFEGRAPGTLGGNLAAKYLALEFDRLNLIPAGDNGTFYQNIPFHGNKPLITSKLNISFEEENINFRLYEDFLLYQTGEPVFIPVSTPIVFAGYGIVAPEFDYNDYQGIDVSGKIVVFIEGEPLSLDSSYFNGNNPTIYSTAEAKQRIALSRGAKGSILIPNVNANRYFDWTKQVSSFSFENLSLAYSASSSFDIMLNPYVADILFMESGYSLNDIFKMCISYSMKSFPLKVQLTFRGEFIQRDFISPNIIGVLPGEDDELKDEYVIVSAHYDHLGIGHEVKGDSIYNGVLDNAMGVSAVLELARVIKQYNMPHNRSLVFILTTGEESGLLGSGYYVKNPVFPLYKTVANVNIDGISSFDEFKNVIGIGSEYSTMQDFLSVVASERNLSLAQVPQEFSNFESFSKSDQHSFAKAGIPSILIYEGLDYVNTGKDEGLRTMIKYSSEIYHTPFDDLSLPINYDAATQHMEILLSIIQNLVNDKSEPEWYSGSPFINERLISTAEKR
ncbi:MAG: M28 family peptidase [bacterium]